MGIFINLKLKFKTGYLLPIRTKSTSRSLVFQFPPLYATFQSQISKRAKFPDKILPWQSMYLRVFPNRVLPPVPNQPYNLTSNLLEWVMGGRIQKVPIWSLQGTNGRDVVENWHLSLPGDQSLSFALENTGAHGRIWTVKPPIINRSLQRSGERIDGNQIIFPMIESKAPKG